MMFKIYTVAAVLSVGQCFADFYGYDDYLHPYGGTSTPETEIILGLCISGGRISGDRNKYAADLKFRIDSNTKLGDINLYTQNSVVLDYTGTYRLNCYMFSSAETTTFAISAWENAKEYWETTLLSTPDITSITLVKADNLWKTFTSSNISFLGQSSSGSFITLGNTTVSYQGCFANMSEAEMNLTGDNQVALVSDNANNQLLLVGKGVSPAPATPEPATATLSLLALAGLCARRRRH